MSEFKLNKDYGKNVFNDTMMKKYLPKTVYEKLKKTISDGVELDSSLSKYVANGIMNWALENGATHYTHWFEPLNDSIAEKQNSFLRTEQGKKPILEFSGKELIKGETDASSFPTGNLRATFEARGYTIWDCTSPAFLRKIDDSVTLCIPTAFISYGGEALDNKTPLLRSMQVISNESIKLLKLFKKSAKNVYSMLGVEQEYFLVDKDKFLQRKDLVYCGRTLVGAKSAKGQELDDHYYGAIKPKVLKFMKEVDEELWLLGVPAKTQHNEVAPRQHELACNYEEANISCDHNQLVMETLKRVAEKHNMVCLLHEKPFKWVNGSGKHNNWSLVTDKGLNLLNPGNTPHENLQFMLVLSCIIAAVDKYALLLRASCATPGKEQRLGASEAPPSIISCFIGEQLNDVVDNFIKNGFATDSKQGGRIKKQINTLPELWLDVTDRNRTSPFAFTGNKFEFRMVGSNDSCAMPITVINTIVASEFKKATDKLSKSKKFEEDVRKIIQENFKEHKRVIFSGDGYSKEWEEEAKKRGLCSVKSIVDAIPAFIDKDVVELFKGFNILSENELKCRYEVGLENYVNITNIEALALIDIAKKLVLPACIHYATRLSNSINAINEVDKNLDSSVQRELLEETLKNIRNLKDNVDLLDKSVKKAQGIKNISDKANEYKNEVVKYMDKLREYVDQLEMIVDKEMWPMPSYGDLFTEI
ncbi:MAG: glutamine synthetase III [Lachnospiraceae bacterium]|nr:glutamine synthetase III [Lachnospiraceae bacterium]